MVFNYAAENKDDHCKNFSFMVTADDAGRPTWRLAPAYDLTRCTEGYNGEHATSVNGTGHPNEADMVAVGAKGQLKPSRCREIIEEVTALCRELKGER
jgi:serine/threonine-protein kinase HipA